MRKGRSLPHCISDNSCDRPGRHLIHCNGSCPFVQFVGNNISLRAICLEFSCKRVQSRTCSDYAERSRKSRRSGTTERSDGNRVRSARIGEVRTMCLEFSCKRAQSRTCSDYAECSRKSRRSSTTPQDLPQSALLAFVQISATDPVAILVSHSLRVHSCNSWAKKYFPKNSCPKFPHLSSNIPFSNQ